MSSFFKRVLDRNVLKPARKIPLVKKAMDRAESLLRYTTSNDLRADADRRVLSGLQSIGLATLAEVRALEARIQDLEKKLVAEHPEAEKKPAAKPAHKPAPKAAREAAPQ